jgi:ATP adenylyltransferase
MRHLFSPWRSAYIQTFNDKKKSKGCLFCIMAKQRNDVDNLIIWRGKTCFVVMNRFPYNSGHLMIVPYKHKSQFSFLTNQELSEAMSATSNCISALKKAMKPHGFNYGANLGRVAGAGIEKHIHFHLVPRWNGDTNFMPILSDVKVVSERLDESAAKLRRSLKSRK